MKAIRIGLCTIVLSLLLAACGTGGAGTVKGSGNVITEQRPVSGVSEVVLDTVGDLIIEQNGEEALTVEAEDNIVPLILTDMAGSRLTIHTKNVSFSTTKGLTYRLSAKALSYIGASSSGSITARSLKSDVITVDVSSAGSVTAVGQAEELHLGLTGSGSYEGREMQVKRANVRLTNAGSGMVRVGDTLDVTLTGTGSLTYIGYPNITSKDTGSGEVMRLDIALPRPTAAPTSVPPTQTPAATSKIELKPCKLAYDVSAECGTYRVYEDREARSGRMIELNVAVVRARSSQAAPDAMVYLSGGPGGAATQDWTIIGTAFKLLNEQRDWLLVDQRGTGHSNPIIYPPLPAEASTVTSAEDANRILVPWLTEALKSIDGNPSFYTTSVAMDDVDEVSRALGYEKVNLYGGSYGATAAQYYLRQHGDRVRTVILDGGTLLDVPIFERIAPMGQRALDMVFDRCKADKECNEKFPNVRKEMQETYDRLSKEPVRVLATLDPSTQKPIVFNQQMYAEAVRSKLLSAAAASELPRLIHLAYRGDYSDLARFYARLAANSVMGARQVMSWEIRCNEAWALNRPAEVERLGKETYFVAPQLQAAVQQAIGCPLLPKGVVPANDAEPVKSDVPVLMLNGDADPQDPPEHVASAGQYLPNSLRVTVPGQGHGTIQYGCLPKVATAFVESGTAKGLDTSCVKDVLIPAFNVND